MYSCATGYVVNITAVVLTSTFVLRIYLLSPYVGYFVTTSIPYVDMSTTDIQDTLNSNDIILRC